MWIHADDCFDWVMWELVNLSNKYESDVEYKSLCDTEPYFREKVIVNNCEF